MKNIAPLIYFFTIYSFVGWMIENTHSFYVRRIFFKPNFLYGPFKPMYGFTPLLLINMISPQTHWLFVILLCFLIPTIVEYITGWLLQKYTYRKWWDYSSYKTNIQGHICLPYSLCWILLSIICIRLVHPRIVASYIEIFAIWEVIAPIFLCYFLLELFLAIKRHTFQTQTIETHG